MDSLPPWMRITSVIHRTLELSDKILWIHDTKGTIKVSSQTYLDNNKNAVLINNFSDKFSSSYQLNKLSSDNPNIDTIIIDAYSTKLNETDLNITVNLDIDHLDDLKNFKSKEKLSLNIPGPLDNDKIYNFARSIKNGIISFPNNVYKEISPSTNVIIMSNLLPEISILSIDKLIVANISQTFSFDEIICNDKTHKILNYIYNTEKIPINRGGIEHYRDRKIDESLLLTRYKLLFMYEGLKRHFWDKLMYMDLEEFIDIEEINNSVHTDVNSRTSIDMHISTIPMSEKEDIQNNNFYKKLPYCL